MKLNIKSENVGQRIRSARKSAGLTQEELGKKIGVTKGAVSQWESGTTISGSSIEYKADNILKLALVLEADPYSILYDENNTQFKNSRPGSQFNNHPDTKNTESELNPIIIKWILETLDIALKGQREEGEVEKLTKSIIWLYKMRCRDEKLSTLDKQTVLDLIPTE